MSELSTGTITFLFTDLEGSTRLWEQHGEAMHDALAHHDALSNSAAARSRTKGPDVTSEIRTFLDARIDGFFTDNPG